MAAILSGAIGVIGQGAAVGIVDDAVVGVMGDARRTLVECAQGESAVAAHARKDEVVQQDRVVGDVEVLDPVDIAVPERRREAEGILSRAAGERVGRQPAIQQIAAAAAGRACRLPQRPAEPAQGGTRPIRSTHMSSLPARLPSSHRPAPSPTSCLPGCSRFRFPGRRRPCSNPGCLRSRGRRRHRRSRATILPSLSSSLTQLSWTSGSAMPSMSIVMTVPAARSTL